MTYRVISAVIAGNIKYYVQYRATFLGFSYWKTLKQLSCGYTDCYLETVYFTSEEEAKEKICEYFSKKALCKEHHGKIVAIGECE